MITMYIRVSLEDGDMQEGTTESNSITSQRELLWKYVSEKEGFRGTAVQECSDDGHTGRNFECPGFQKIVEQCRMAKNQLYCGEEPVTAWENYVEVGNLLEQVMPGGRSYLRQRRNWKHRNL